MILFLHGWQDNLHTFDLLVSSLAQANRIVRLDLPGFGKSEMPKEIWDVEKYVLFVFDFIEKLNLRVEVLVGHSFGGRIVIKGAAAGKFCPEKIILVGSAGVSSRRILRNLILKVLAKIAKVLIVVPPLFFWREKLREKMYALLQGDYAKSRMMKGTFLKIIGEDLADDAKKIRVPTLLIWGAGDTQTPLLDGKKLSELIKDSQLKIFDGAGHFVHKEKPEEVAKLIQEFL